MTQLTADGAETFVKHIMVQFGATNRFLQEVQDIAPHFLWEALAVGTDVKLGKVSLAFSIDGQQYKAKFLHRPPQHGIWVQKNGQDVAGPFDNATPPQVIRELFAWLAAGSGSDRPT
jgi:hypothetical protein